MFSVMNSGQRNHFVVPLQFKYFETEFETEKLTLIKEIDNRNTNDQK